MQVNRFYIHLPKTWRIISACVLLSLALAHCHVTAAVGLNSSLIAGEPVAPVDQASLTVAGYLFADHTDTRLNLSDPTDQHLSELLERSGPDIRPSRDFKDFEDISLEVSKRAWSLLHKHASVAIQNRVDFVRPAIEQVLLGAAVSAQCRSAVGYVLEGAKRMDSWAIKMLNSWGDFPPVGLFDGTYTEVGSFHSCVNVAENSYIGHAHYCSITYRPVMPSRKNYELIVRKEPEELLQLFNRSGGPPDAFQDLLEHSQYHHYLYYKWGTCWPIGCSPFDIRQTARYMGRKNILMTGPVKCYSKFSQDYEQPATNSTRKLVISTWDLNNGIYIWKPYFNDGQMLALWAVMTASLLMILMTLIDLFLYRMPQLYRWFQRTVFESQNSNNHRTDHRGSSRYRSDGLHKADCMNAAPCTTTYDIALTAADNLSISHNAGRVSTSSLENIVRDCSIITSTLDFFSVTENQLKNEIICLNGIRCITMFWIIMTHTMMYNDWSAFARTREIEGSIKSLLNQPLFNGSYLVDIFFLMSGLLSSYTAFRHSQGLISKFRSAPYIFGRWLRLTPQVFLVSMLFILLPAVSTGPHWFPMTGEYSENCISNWWINVLHLQSFYKKEKMCNFVTWWISIDFFYHFYALAFIWLVLIAGHKSGFWSMAALVAGHVAWQAIRHYEQALPPNVLSSIPQTGAMWTVMTQGFFWTPHTHVVPFFSGFYIGYLMALKRKLITKFFSPKRAAIGWTLSSSLLFLQSYSTFWWVTGQTGYPRLVSTIYYVVCPIIWAGSLCWTILACHHGYGGFINRILSWKGFIVMGKASYFIYLSHFQVLFNFFGNQSILLEPTQLVMFYIVVGNIFVATLYGTILCIVFEHPWLKLQRYLLKCI